MATTSVNNSNAAVFTSLNANSTRNSTSETEDRFLKLLVAQIQNQDPLNPLDNHQVTSQMAQINTVNGIDKLNRTVAALGTQFASLQVMQGASLVGRQVTVPGDGLQIENNIGSGGFELASAADQVRVEILGPGSHVVDTMKLGALGSGQHDFDWPARNVGADSTLRFRVVAVSGAANVGATLLTRDRVEAVSTRGDTLTLELARGGAIAWTEVREFN